MKILIFAHDAGLYGASQSLLSIVEHLVNTNRFKIMVLLPYGGPIEKFLNAKNIPYKIIYFPRCVSSFKANENQIAKLRIRLRYLWKNYKALQQLKILTSIFAPDVIYTNTSVVSTGYYIANKLKIPHVWHIREFGDIDYGFTYLPSKHTIKRYIAKSKCIFVSQKLKQNWFNNTQIDATIIHNGIDILEPKTINYPQEGKINLGLLGAITPGKGQLIALQAYVKFLDIYPNANLHFYGGVIDNDYFRALKQLILDFKIESKVIFHGFVENENIYSQLDVILNCSEHEGFGRSVIEAMMNSKPVIGNNSGGLPEIINHQVNGYLYEKSDQSLLTNLLELFHSKDNYINITRNGYQKAREHFSSARYLSNVSEILKKAANVKKD
ncbi:glycosyltransferase family 4 protein [Pedobacter puniceum]|uniref:Glycosyltransferase n=1 Tax=Pedobacter puniceum TaxID=2666136 RepID=A0A7K0FJ56_9SPHI|nr:glycosyltransferase family 4 protein [Pedobacter puniceum]MRX45681.1 glycosyltransferase [Pedobacter puniceum]